MKTIGQKIVNANYSERRSSYAILENSEGKIAVVNIKNWGLIFPGGKIEKSEDAKETIKRETLEEIGYEVDNLKYFNTVEAYYKIKLQIGLIDCHNVADFYTGTIKEKIQEPMEKNHNIEWYYPNELFGKMELDFQNVVLEEIYK